MTWKIAPSIALSLFVCAFSGRVVLAQPVPPDEPRLEPASQPAEPTTMPEARPAPPAPPPPSPAPAPPRLREPGEPCRVHSDCRRPMWCIDGRCALSARATEEVFGQERKQEEEKEREPARAGSPNDKGNVMLGGMLTFTPNVIVPDYGDSRSGVQLTISPSFGYFVSHGLELGFTFIVGASFGELYKGSTSNVALGPSLRYLFGSGKVLPYIGLLVGPEFLIPDEGDTATFFDLSLRLGMLVPLNPHVALSFGVRPTFAFGVGNIEATIITIPIGWLGVEAFF